MNNCDQCGGNGKINGIVCEVCCGTGDMPMPKMDIETLRALLARANEADKFADQFVGSVTYNLLSILAKLDADLDTLLFDEKELILVDIDDSPPAPVGKICKDNNGNWVIAVVRSWEEREMDILPRWINIPRKCIRLREKCPTCEGTGEIYVCPGCGARGQSSCNASSMECWDAGNWFGSAKDTCPECRGSGNKKD